MERSYSLSLPDGYQIFEKEEELKIWQAEEILVTDKIKKYIRAVREGDKATLLAHYLRCPHCGKTIPANSFSPLLVPQWYRRFRSFSKAHIRRWANMQMSLFDEGRIHILQLADPVKPYENFVCPKCGMTSAEAKRMRQVEISARKQKVMVRAEIMEMSELLKLPWLQTKELRLCFPLYERVTFDLHRGAVYVCIEDRSGTALAHWDVTDHPRLLSGGAVDKVLRSHRQAVRLIKKLFQEIQGAALPFSDSAFDVNAIFLATRFVGYPAPFYYCIPFMRGTTALDPFFRKRAKKLHFAAALPGLYDKLGLPKAKSVRRLLFENPGLFFYGQEVARLWEILRDSNLLCRLLKADERFRILAAMAMYPGIDEYLRDFISVRGAVCLVEEMLGAWDTIRGDAIRYSAMNEQMRHWMRERLQEEDDHLLLQRGWAPFSLPVNCADVLLPECTVEGYRFRWLRNNNEIIQAGQALKNCLTRWYTTESNVMGVMKNGRYVAAIEVIGMAVRQARGAENCPLEDDPPLHHAFETWMAQYHLEMEEEF